MSASDDEDIPFFKRHSSSDKSSQWSAIQSEGSEGHLRGRVGEDKCDGGNGEDDNKEERGDHKDGEGEQKENRSEQNEGENKEKDKGENVGEDDEEKKKRENKPDEKDPGEKMSQKSDEDEDKPILEVHGYLEVLAIRGESSQWLYDSGMADPTPSPPQRSSSSQQINRSTALLPKRSRSSVYPKGHPPIRSTIPGPFPKKEFSKPELTKQEAVDKVNL